MLKQPLYSVKGYTDNTTGTGTVGIKFGEDGKDNRLNINKGYTQISHSDHYHGKDEILVTVSFGGSDNMLDSYVTELKYVADEIDRTQLYSLTVGGTKVDLVEGQYDYTVCLPYDNNMNTSIVAEGWSGTKLNNTNNDTYSTSFSKDNDKKNTAQQFTITNKYGDITNTYNITVYVQEERELPVYKPYEWNARHNAFGPVGKVVSGDTDVLNIDGYLKFHPVKSGTRDVIVHDGYLEFTNPSQNGVKFTIPGKGDVIVKVRSTYDNNQTGRIRFEGVDGNNADAGKFNAYAEEGSYVVRSRHYDQNGKQAVTVDFPAGGSSHTAYIYSIAYIPELKTMEPYESGRKIEFNGNDFDRGKVEEVYYNKGTDSDPKNKIRFRLTGDANHKFSPNYQNTGGIKFDNTSCDFLGFIEVPVTKKGTVKIYAKGLYDTSSFQESTENLSTNTETTIEEWDASRGIRKELLATAQPGDVVNVQIKSRGKESGEGKPAPYFRVKHGSFWADFSQKYITEMKLYSNSDGSQIGTLSDIDAKNGHTVGNAGNTTAESEYTIWSFALTEGMLREIRESGSMQLSGRRIVIGDVTLTHKSGRTDAQISINTGTAPELSLAPIMTTYTKEIKLYTDDATRKLYIGGTENTLIEKIEWTPDENVEAKVTDLVAVSGMTVWNKGNKFGYFSYPSEGRSVPVNELNLGRYSDTNAEQNVPGNSLLIFNEDNRETNFTKTGLISLHKAPHLSENVEGAKMSNVCAIKVNGPGVLRIEAWGTGPSGRDLEVTRQPSKDTGSFSVFRSDRSGNDVLEHHLNWPRHQYSTWREIYAKVDVPKETQQVLYIWGEVHIEEIRWIPVGEEVTVNGRTYYGDYDRYNLTEDGCLTIKYPSAEQNEGRIILNPNTDAANRNKETAETSDKYDYTGIFASNNYTFEVEVTDSKWNEYDSNGNSLRVPVDKKQPMFTSSQDGRYNGVYDGIINSIHNARPAINSNGGVDAATNTYRQPITLKSPTKPGVVYVTCGTYEGNRSETRRIEVAGPDEGINYVDEIVAGTEGTPVRKVSSSVKDIPTILITKPKNGSTVKQKLAAYPYRQANDVDQGVVFIKVDDPTITWSFTPGHESDNVVSLPDNRSPLPQQDFTAAGSYNTDWSEIEVTVLNGGETMVRATTVKGNYVDFKLVVMDESELWLDRIKPVETGSVSVYEDIRFIATGNYYKNQTDEKTGYVDLPVEITFFDTAKNHDVTVRVESNITVNEEGDVIVIYDVVGALKEQYPDDYEHMLYETEHKLRFVNPVAEEDKEYALTRDLFNHTECSYDYGNSANCVYGHSAVQEDKYAYLSDYSELQVTVTEGSPRFFFNKTDGDAGANDDNCITINSDTNKYVKSVIDNPDGSKTWVINLDLIESENDGQVRLNAIKASAWNTEVTVKDAVLVGNINDNDRLVWTDANGQKITDKTFISVPANDTDTNGSATAQPDCNYYTVPNPSSIMEEVFIYNVAQRLKTTVDGQTGLKADLEAIKDGDNKPTGVGQLLSENKYKNESGTMSWSCNHRSLITVTGFENPNKKDYLQKKDAATAAKFEIKPQDTDKTGIQEAIKSIKIDCNQETSGNAEIKFYVGEYDETVEGNVRWTLVDALFANEANAYSVVWTPSSPVHYAKVEIGDKAVKVDQLKINYYTNRAPLNSYYANFAAYTDKLTGEEQEGYTSFDRVLTDEGLAISTPRTTKNDKSASNVKMTVKKSQRGDRRHFTLRCEYNRETGNGYNRGESLGTISDAKKNVMVIRDDKTDPCVMKFQTTDNKAKIAYIEFLYEVDNQRNGFTDPRMIYCTSDPRQNIDEEAHNMVGWKLDPQAIDVDNDTPTKDDGFFGDMSNLRKLVYCPESPTNYATFALNANEEGFIFVRGIIVRTTQRAEQNAYTLVKTSKDDATLNVEDAKLYTTGIDLTKQLDIDLATADEDTKTALTGQGIANEDEAKGYLMKRTSLRNNLSQEIVLGSISENDNNVKLNRNNSVSDDKPANYLHNKNYTVRVLNENRMVIRQLTFHTEQNEAPAIANTTNNDNKPNTDRRANDPLSGSKRDIEFTITANDNFHKGSDKLIVYSLDGTEPKVYFKPDGRTIDRLEPGCDYAAGPTVTIKADAVESMMKNNSIVVKAIALPLTGSSADFDLDSDDNEVTTYGEPSEITRANYTFVDDNTYLSSARRDKETDELSTDLTGEGYNADFADYITGYDMKNINQAGKDEWADRFHAAYAPLKPQSELHKLNLNNGDEKKGMLTYGGYEMWNATDAPADGLTPGKFHRNIINNDYWMVKTNDLTNYRGIRTAIAGDAYIVSKVLPMNEQAGWTGSGKVADGTVSPGDIVPNVSEFFTGSSKTATKTGPETYADNAHIRGWQGEFSSRKLESIDKDVNGNDITYSKTWQLPCYGDYFQFEPEANGTLTVYVKQEGVLAQEDGALDDVILYARPVFVYDEAGNTPAGITAETSSKISGDWMTTAHTKQDGHDSEVINNRYLTHEGAEALLNLCDAWISNNTRENGNEGNLEFGDRAYRPQGVINFYGPQDPQYNYTGVDENLATILGSYDRSQTGANRNGFVIISEGYVKYEFPVKAGKSYFVFAQSGNLGFCSYTFKKAEGYAATDVTYNNAADDANNVIVDKSNNTSSIASKVNDGQAYNVTLARNFTAGRWTPLVLPFSVGKQQMRRIFGDGVEIIHFDEMVNPDLLRLRKHVHQMVVAGVPVFIKPSKSSNGVTFRNVSFETADVQKIVIGAGDTAYECVGSFKKETFDMKKNSWYISGGKFSRNTYVFENQVMNGTVPYIQPVTQEGRSLKTPQVGFNRFIEDGDDDAATAIEVVVNAKLGNEANSDGNVMLDNNVYDAAGRLVRHNTTDLEGLPAGVYIVNGEKKAVK